MEANIVDVSSCEELKAAVAERKWARGPWAGSCPHVPLYLHMVAVHGACTCIFTWCLYMVALHGVYARYLYMVSVHHILAQSHASAGPYVPDWFSESCCC